MNQHKKIDRKQSGFILSAELVLIATILVIGMIVGMVTMRDALTAEMGDVAEAIGAIDQGYQFDGLINGESSATVAGSAFVDASDSIAGDGRYESFVASDGTEATLNVIGPSADDFAGGGSITPPGAQ